MQSANTTGGKYMATRASKHLLPNDNLNNMDKSNNSNNESKSMVSARKDSIDNDSDREPSIDLSKELSKAIDRINQCEKEIKKLSVERNAFKNECTTLIAKNTLIENELNEYKKQTTFRKAQSPPRKVAKSKSTNNLDDGEDMSLELDNEFPDLPSCASTMNLNFDRVNNASNKVNTNACPTKNSTNIANSSCKANSSLNNNNSFNKKIIQASDCSIFQIRNSLINAKVNDFTVKQVKKNGPVKITINGHEQVANAKNALLKSKINFHEFLNKNEKRKCFVIRGLVGANLEDLPFIKSELVNAGLPESIEVSFHETGFIKANANANKLVKLIVPPNMDVSLLKTIPYLNHIVVRFEEFISKSIIQCKNCQRFGHSAAGCQHTHRCVKCGQNHFKNDCPRTKDHSVKLNCCNCGGDHTANNLNACQYFISNFVNKKPKDNVVQKNEKTAPPSIKVNKQLSFANAAKMVDNGSPKSSQNSSRGHVSSASSSAMPSSSSSNSANSNIFDDLYKRNIDLRFSSLETKINSLTEKFEQLITIIQHCNTNNIDYSYE